MKCKGMCIAIISTAILTLPAAIFAQDEPMNQGASPSQPNQSSMQQAGANGQDTGNGAAITGQTMKDKMFLRRAAEGGMAEVKFGELAAQKASSEDVKDFGQKMVKDHTMLNDEMTPICQQMGVRTPTKLNKKDQAEYDKLDGLSGDAFDKEYMSAMVKDHHKDLEQFRREIASTQNAELKETVTKGEKVIDEHAKLADKLAQEKGVAVSGEDKETAEQ